HAEDAEPFARELAAQELTGCPPAPRTATDERRAFAGAAEHCEEVQHGDLRNRIGENVRSVEDRQSAPARTFNVEMIEADGVRGDRAHSGINCFEMLAPQRRIDGREDHLVTDRALAKRFWFERPVRNRERIVAAEERVDELR